MNTAVARYLEYDDATHTYYVDGEEVPSITQVLKEVGAIDDTYFTEEHARRGTLVHAMTEQLDRPVNEKSATFPSCTKEELDVAARYTAQWVKLRENVAFKIEDGGIEEKVFDPIHCYAGRADRRVKFSAPCVSRAFIEIKTNRSGYVPIWTGLQLAAQCHAKEPGELFRRFAFVLTPDRYLVHEFPTSEFVNDRDTFLAMVRTVRWRRANL
jgi:hypothetical protein